LGELKVLQERTWALRWRNPVFCKRLLYNRLENRQKFTHSERPLQFNLAWLERWSGNFDAAARLADQAFDLMDPEKDPEAWSELLVIKSVCVYCLGELSKADEILGESFDILGPAAHGEAGVEPLTVLANMCADYHDYDKARSKLQQAMAIAEKLDLVFERARIFQIISRAEQRCGSPEAAVAAAQSSLELSLEHRNAVCLPYAYEVLGTALAQTGDFEGARQNAKKGLSAAKASQDIRAICHLNYVLGQSYLDKKKYQEAREVLETGLRKASSVDYHHWTRNFYLKLSQTHEILQDYRTALDYLKSYMDLQSKVFTEDAERQSNDFRNRLEYRLAHSKAEYEHKVRTNTEALNGELQEANDALRELNAQIEHNALHDALTGVGNRRMLARFFETVAAESEPNTKISAILIDLDRFKWINDKHGHAAGDLILTKVAERLSSMLQERETLIRMGGDEFLVLSTQRTSLAELNALSDEILRLINSPMTLAVGDTKAVGASVGISVCKIGSENEIDLLRMADEALYDAKQTGRNKTCIHPGSLT
jgi:diguanylate cyclase